MKLPQKITDANPRMLRQFATGWLIVFLGAGLYRYVVFGQRAMAVGLIAVAGVGIVLFRVAPGIFRRVFIAATLLAFPIGWITSQLMLAIMFYGVVTPLALLFRLGKRDRLSRVKLANRSSYWREKKMRSDIHSYFRTY